MDYDNEVNLENAILYTDSSRGVYIPQHFAESIKRECVSGVSEEDWEILMGDPYGDDSQLYWDSWYYVECNAILTDPSNGKRYTLYQDGDLWLVPIEGE